MTRYFFESIGTNARQLDELPPMPWISSRTSPAPSSRYATRSPCNVIIFRFVISAALSPFWLGGLPVPHVDEASLGFRAWNFLNGGVFAKPSDDAAHGHAPWRGPLS